MIEKIAESHQLDLLLLYGIFQKAIKLYEKEPGIFARYRAYAFKQYVETRDLRACNKI